MTTTKPPVGAHSSHGIDRILASSQEPSAYTLKVGGGKLTLEGGPLPEPPLAEDDPPLNELRRFRLEPDDRSPLEFVGKLLARAAVERAGGRTRTWLGLYETRAGKAIMQMSKHDGTARNVAWSLGEQRDTVRVFENVDEALATVRSPTLKHQLLTDLGRDSVEFIE